ncbi:hypothetical protein Anapl_18198 [Anas platyrhynchos]|uniref:Uncharacterized protein n=1 Tax=Anas platyrhynchos TaxID=8839 RepID=R0LAG8_ANAPL|nr:hypothetical protein Anapl_18198 [Anas platyrhynchos]
MKPALRVFACLYEYQARHCLPFLFTAVLQTFCASYHTRNVVLDYPACRLILCERDQVAKTCTEPRCEYEGMDCSFSTKAKLTLNQATALALLITLVTVLTPVTELLLECKQSTPSLQVLSCCGALHEQLEEPQENFTAMTSCWGGLNMGEVFEQKARCHDADLKKAKGKEDNEETSGRSKNLSKVEIKKIGYSVKDELWGSGQFLAGWLQRPKGTQPNESSSQLDGSFSPGTSPGGQVSGWALVMGASLSAEEEAIVKLLTQLLVERGVENDPLKIKLLLKFLRKQGFPSMASTLKRVKTLGGAQLFAEPVLNAGGISRVFPAWPEHLRQHFCSLPVTITPENSENPWDAQTGGFLLVCLLNVFQVKLLRNATQRFAPGMIVTSGSIFISHYVTCLLGGVVAEQRCQKKFGEAGMQQAECDSQHHSTGRWTSVTVQLEELYSTRR